MYCILYFNKLAWWWLNNSKHVVRFNIKRNFTNRVCVWQSISILCQYDTTFFQYFRLLFLQNGGGQRALNIYSWLKNVQFWLGGTNRSIRVC